MTASIGLLVAAMISIQSGAAVATGLAILRRFAQPNDHELLVHAAVIAERDPDIMVAINRLGKEERKRQKEDNRV